MRARVLLGCLLVLGLQSARADTLVVEYRDKPPYTYTAGGRPAGFLYERTRLIFERAGVAVRFAEMPARRTLRRLQDNEAAVCSLGLFRLAEREAFLRYSLPIHHSRPHVVLAHASVAAKVRALPGFADLIASPTLRPGLVDGVSYGPQLDHLLAKTAVPAVRAQLTPLQLARMVGARRVDYMLIDEEDLAWLRQDASFTPLPLVRVEFADMPPGELRYLACSHQVSPQTMDRLNQAIRELVPEASKQ